jgi:hypothetical protein
MISQLPGGTMKMRVSLYADDAVIFVNPDRDEVDKIMEILQGFGDASGLCLNPAKSTVAPIRCDGIDLATVLHNFGGQVVGFPIRYLGMPVVLGRIRLVHLQYILDRIRARLAGWKGRLMPISGRRVLVRCVLSALPAFTITVLRAPRKFYKDIDKARRKFLWAQDDEITGGKCKVNWQMVTSPVECGGLGIPDMSRYATALRLRWLWFAWRSPERPWVDGSTPCDDKDKAMFAATTSVTVRSGTRASFWHCNWLGGQPLRLAYPDLFAHSLRKNRTVAAALQDDRWILDLRHGNTDQFLPQFIQLLRLIRGAGINLVEGVDDEITWTAGGGDAYTARYAYSMQFSDRPRTKFRSLIWKTWAPGKIKIFSWLLHHNRLWCNDRLQRRGWENRYFCALCNRNLESSMHLFWECSFSKMIWSQVATWRGCESLHPNGWAHGKTTTEIITSMADRATPTARKGVWAMIGLILWHIWLERNGCTFRRRVPSPGDVISASRSELEQWRLAGAKCLEPPFGDVT